MRVAITGGTGLIGTALTEALRARGDLVVIVSRRGPAGATRVVWDPAEGFEAHDALVGIDAVINLAGESVAGRWTARKKTRIHDSRQQATQAVIAAIEQAGAERPRVLVNASAVGFYGSTGEQPVDESSPPGDDFLATVTRDWERAAAAVEHLTDPPVRLCVARIGVVLSADGGALAKMLPAFRMGVGGKLGSGQQWMSWISLHDVVAALMWLLDHDDARGAYNLVAPTPVRNAEFTAALGRVLRRPTVMPIPRFGVKLAFGEMGDTVLLHGQQVVPRRLLDAGFTFADPQLEPVLASLLAK